MMCLNRGQLRDLAESNVYMKRSCPICGNYSNILMDKPVTCRFCKSVVRYLYNGMRKILYDSSQDSYAEYDPNYRFKNLTQPAKTEVQNIVLELKNKLKGG